MRDDGEKSGTADEVSDKCRQDEAAHNARNGSLFGQHQQPGLRGSCHDMGEPPRAITYVTITMTQNSLPRAFGNIQAMEAMRKPAGVANSNVVFQS